LSQEFNDLLKPYKPEDYGEPAEVNNHHGGVIDIFQGDAGF